jgi:Ca2+/Na+ antiporter
MSRKIFSEPMKRSTYIIICVVIAVIFFLIGYKIQIVDTMAEFFSISFYQIIYLLFMFFIMYQLTQYKIDQRSEKESKEKLLFKNAEITEKILSKLYLLITDDRFCTIQKQEDIDYVNQQHRRISNFITTLNKFEFNENYEKNMEIILEKVDAHRELIGNHLNDPNFLNAACLDLKNYVDSIQDKINDNFYEIYNSNIDDNKE